MGTQYKTLLPVTVILLTICLLTLPIGYQIVQVGPYTFSAVALIIPIRYLICDIISEVYGYYIAKKVIWLMLFCSFLFSIIISNIIKLPAPAHWSHHAEYQFVLGSTFKVILYASLGVLVGSFLNIYLVSKWKLLTNGKIFWLRSLGGSIIGDITQYLIGLTLIFHNLFSWQDIFKLIISDYVLQSIILTILAPVAQLIMYKLKKIEKSQIKEQIISINPFKIKE